MLLEGRACGRLLCVLGACVACPRLLVAGLVLVVPGRACSGRLAFGCLVGAVAGVLPDLVVAGLEVEVLPGVTAVLFRFGRVLVGRCAVGRLTEAPPLDGRVPGCTLLPAFRLGRVATLVGRALP